MKKFLKGAKAWLTGHSGMALYATVLLIAVLVSLNAAVYALTTRYQLYLYSSEKAEAEISENSDLYFERAMKGGRRVQITFCDEETNVAQHETGSFVYKTAMAMAQKYPDFLSVRFVNSITGFDSEGNYVDLKQYVEYTDDGVQVPITRASIIFECEGNHRTLVGGSVGYEDFFTITSSGSTYAYNGEEVLAAMICWVTESEHKTVYFTQNHGETADPALNAALVSAGYYVKVINLRKDNIDIKNTALVVISNPVADFEKGSGVVAELEKLERYLSEGGSLYVALDPLVKKLPNLEGFLEEKGFSYCESTDENGSLVREIIRDDVNGLPTAAGYAFVLTPGDNAYARPVFRLMDTYVDGSVLANDAARLHLSNGAQPLLTSSPESVAVSAGKITDNGGSYAVVGYNRFENEDGSYAQIVVAPCVYLTSTEAMVNDTYVNKAFITSLCGTYFGATSTPMGCQALLYETGALEGFTIGNARLYTALILAIPAALAIVGTVIIIRRKNR